jgi:energy-coupling factor transporter transmembrane protein EcfT
VNPFAFEPQGSPLAGISALAKGIFLLCVSVAAMKYRLIPLSMLACAGLLIQCAAGISFHGMGKTSLFIFYLSLFSAIVRGILPGEGRFFAIETLPDSALYSLRLVSVFIYARLYYVSTKSAALGDFLTNASRKISRLLRPAPKKKPFVTQTKGSRTSPAGEAGILSDPGMLLSLSLLFLPRVFENYTRVRDAAVLRGFGASRKKFLQVLPMLQTFIFMSIKGALLTARAMELRGYSSGRTLDREKFDGVDVAIACMGLSLLCIAFLPGVA